MKLPKNVIGVCLKQCYKCREFTKKYSNLKCVYLDNPIEGWGDVVAFITFYLHIPHCSHCERRRVWMNDHLYWPFKIKKPLDNLILRAALRRLRVKKFPVILTKDLQRIITIDD